MSRLISFLLIAYSLQLNATNWYVDFQNTSGTYNGQSWATAWRTLDKFWTKIGGNIVGVDWDLIGAGDTIYVSGGSDSTTYIAQQLNSSGYTNTMSFNPPVVICPSWESNHNGDIYIINTNQNKIGLGILGFTGLKISNFKVYHLPGIDSPNQQCCSIELADSISIDSCHFVSDGGATVLTFSDASYCTLSNSTLETLTNYFPNSGDILGLTAGASPIAGANKIINNVLIGRPQYEGVSGTANVAVTTTDTSLTDTRLSMVTNYHIGARVSCNGQIIPRVTSNTSNTFYGDGWVDSQPANGLAWGCVSDAHLDIIQIGGEKTYGNGFNLTTVIANNYLWSYSNTFPMSNIIYANGTGQQRFLVYNNIINVTSTDPVSPLALTDNEAGQYNTAFVYNNTFIVPDGSPIYTRPMDSLAYKNNIVLSNGDLNTTMLTIGYNATVFDTCYKDVDYNHYYLKTPASNFASASTVGASGHTWDAWVLDGYDTHSDTGYIALTNVRDSVKTAYYTTTGRDVGVDLSAIAIPEGCPPLDEDILGNARDATWDMGALEFQGASPPSINGGWLSGSDSRKIYSKDGKAIILRVQ